MQSPTGWSNLDEQVRQKVLRYLKCGGAREKAERIDARAWAAAARSRTPPRSRTSETISGALAAAARNEPPRRPTLRGGWPGARRHASAAKGVPGSQAERARLTIHGVLEAVCQVPVVREVGRRVLPGK